MSIKDLDIESKDGAMAVDAVSDDTTSVSAAGGYSKAEERRLLRKLDWSLLPCLAMMSVVPPPNSSAFNVHLTHLHRYLCNALDKG